MFAGHIGAALVIARVETRLNLGIFIFAALLLDVLLWIFVLAGWETVTIRPDFGVTHQPAFVFPYSHGLLASVAWAMLAGATVLVARPGRDIKTLRAAVLVGAAVFSHWLLDALVHVPELPLVGIDSAKVGLGLWQDMPVALAVEALIVVAGLGIFIPGARLSRNGKLWLTTLSLVLLAFTVAGLTIAPAPPSATAMAASSLVTILVVGVVACWIGAAVEKTQPHAYAPQRKNSRV